ncbi:MAG TPA: uL15 family ribosomal protein [Candidatus Paceibacterota bacterium]|nr:uL15 family ribosomal protein [Candidatus Paceibacterota bacterium]
MQIHNLIRKTPNEPKPLVGRGGKRGKTSGRGTKGQLSRSGNKKRPELRDFIKRIPKLRGEGKKGGLKSIAKAAVPVPLSALEKGFKSGDRIEPATLVEQGIVEKIDGNYPRIKILGDGEVTKAFTVSGVEVSASAKAALEKAGGKVHA